MTSALATKPVVTVTDAGRFEETSSYVAFFPKPGTVRGRLGDVYVSFEIKDL